jgi:hypothetical protein
MSSSKHTLRSTKSSKKNNKNFYSEEDKSIQDANDKINDYYKQIILPAIINSAQKQLALNAHRIQYKIRFFRYVSQIVTPNATLKGLDVMINNSIKNKNKLDITALLNRLKELNITLTEDQLEDITISKEEMEYLHQYYIDPTDPRQKFDVETGANFFFQLTRWGLPYSGGGKTLRKTKKPTQTRRKHHKKIHKK